jgi:hypothetical protein
MILRRPGHGRQVETAFRGIVVVALIAVLFEERGFRYIRSAPQRGSDQTRQDDGAQTGDSGEA